MWVSQIAGGVEWELTIKTPLPHWRTHDFQMIKSLHNSAHTQTHRLTDTQTQTHTHTHTHTHTRVKKVRHKYDLRHLGEEETEPAGIAARTSAHQIAKEVALFRLSECV